MPQPEAPTPARADFMQAIQRCAAAFHRVRAELPQDPYRHVDQDNQHKASLAFLAELPILCDLQSFQLYIACIAQGAAIGAIDPVDIGRFCHIAQTAISAWKLANLIVPAAQAKQQEAEQKQQAAEQKEERAAQIKSTPLPPKGNHHGQITTPEVDQALQEALANLPTTEVQKQHFQSLRNRGLILPSNPELRDNPLAALHFVRVAEELLRNEALAEAIPSPKPSPKPSPEKLQPAQEPAPAQKEQPHQAA